MPLIIRSAFKCCHLNQEKEKKIFRRNLGFRKIKVFCRDCFLNLHLKNGPSMYDVTQFRIISTPSLIVTS